MNQTKTATLSTKVPPRVFALNALQILGIAAAALAVPSPETAAVLAMLPPAIGLNVGKIALALLAAKPGINIIGDLIDNGKIDGSYKNGLGRFPLYIFLAFASALFFTGCGLNINPPDAEGCFLISRTEKGTTYAAGPCSGEEGKIYAYRTEWTNADGVKLRATYILEGKKTVIEYRTPDGVWVRWSSKAGITLDGLPPGAQPSLAG